MKLIPTLERSEHKCGLCSTMTSAGMTWFLSKKTGRRRSTAASSQDSRLVYLVIEAHLGITSGSQCGDMQELAIKKVVPARMRRTHPL